jgi:hypothetical protein
MATTWENGRNETLANTNNQSTQQRGKKRMNKKRGPKSKPKGQNPK